MIEAVADGGGNADEVTLFARCLDDVCPSPCRAAPWGRVSRRRAFVPPTSLLPQPAFPHHATRPESTVGSTLRSSAEPRDQTSVLLTAPAVYSAQLDRQVHSNSPEPGGEGRFHATERPPARLARPRGGSHRAARLRRVGRAEQHAVADDAGGEGQGQERATGVQRQALRGHCHTPS